MNLREQIENFTPFDDAEKENKRYILKWIDTFDDVLTRKNEFGHFTSSAFVVNKDRTKMLVVYHNIFDGWIYPGGHADGEIDLLSVALREVEEETDLKARILSENIFAISAFPVGGHIKRGKYVPAHTHLDVVYLFEADDNLELSYREDESKGVMWFDFEEAVNGNIVEFARPVHKRLIYKLSSNE